ncbi:MAG: 4-hydroxy-3-methylbut-2-enyl diphosphate reductase [Bacteroidetes bacterium]|nr:MAG: 4-hydroxy-3-methylbut-2-enyl diphosphate reductase [Bacteroidota bacterium]
MKIDIQIDPGAGLCFGVQRAIQMAEELLKKQDSLACLGDLIHNEEEVNRLKSKGLQVVSHCKIVEQSGKKLLLRAHGEPPSTFRIAENYDVELIDATCPIVSRLQKKVAKACEQMMVQKGQVILFGDINHAEIIALKGFCKGELHIVRDISDLEKLNPAKPTIFFSQTTKYKSDYLKVVKAYRQMRKKGEYTEYPLKVVSSVCKQIAKRDLQLIDFLQNKDVLVFVSGKESSNGNNLFRVGAKQVKKAYFISNSNELKADWFMSVKNIAISGATSTPLWLLKKTYSRIEELLS